MNLSRLNSITATIVACLNCGCSVERTAAKLSAKYAISDGDARALILAIQSISY